MFLLLQKLIHNNEHPNPFYILLYNTSRIIVRSPVLLDLLKVHSYKVKPSTQLNWYYEELSAT
jgi:hypothetical protein